MPMIDVYAAEDTFKDKHTLAQDLAKAVMRWERVPQIPLFFDNTAAFIHELPADAISNAAGDSRYVRVQVLTPIHVLDREKQLGVVKELRDRRGRGRRPKLGGSHLGIDHRIARGRLGHRRPRQHERRHRCRGSGRAPGEALGRATLRAVAGEAIGSGGVL